LLTLNLLLLAGEAAPDIDNWLRDYKLLTVCLFTLLFGVNILADGGGISCSSVFKLVLFYCKTGFFLFSLFVFDRFILLIELIFFIDFFGLKVGRSSPL
jgi:hypothetical protein